MSNHQNKKEEAKYYNRLYAANKYREQHNLHAGAPVPAWVYITPEQQKELEIPNDQPR